MDSMTSSRPYLVRALYEWIVDNDMTPHLLVNADFEGVEVPREHVDDGKIVLNVSPTAARDIELGNDYILFSARFGGQPMGITLPIGAVLAVYARENGQGMIFSEDDAPPPPEPPEPPAPDEGGGRAHLKVVK